MTDHTTANEVTERESGEFCKRIKLFGDHYKGVSIQRALQEFVDLRKPSSENKGPGTPSWRFNMLVNELEKRFPKPKPFDSTKTPEEYALETIDKLILAVSPTPTIKNRDAFEILAYNVGLNVQRDTDHNDAHYLSQVTENVWKWYRDEK